MIDKSLYKDKKLTKAQQKKIKPANQGGGPNYLGKQKQLLFLRNGYRLLITL